MGDPGEPVHREAFEVDSGTLAWKGANGGRDMGLSLNGDTQ